MAIQFRVLGSVEVYAGGIPIDLGHARQRCVLSVLLADLNRPVSTEQLLDRVWDGRPPQRGRDAVYGYLSRLRSALSAAPGVTIVRRHGGYVLEADDRSVDLHRFRALAVQARQTADPAAQWELYGQALDLWRGPAFGELDTAWIASLRAALSAERQAAQLDRVDAGLRCAKHSELLPELMARADENPLDERAAGQLMIALYRSGRPAGALERYQRIRECLAEELGTDPGPELQRLHQRILNGDRDLTSPAPRARPRATPVPRQLWTAPARFVGRDQALAALDAAFDQSGSRSRTVLVCALVGAGGMGKTWLGLRWAHQHLQEFPDGQLCVDLQGFSPSEEPMPPSVALRGFLEALGVAPTQVPSDLHARTALFRSLTADRRMLVLLDNAADAAQVEPLLPGGTSSAVLVTSRRSLVRLAARHGATQLRLKALDATEARQALTAALGADRIRHEPDAVDVLLRYCAGYPLALAVVAGRANTTPGTPLTRLAEELGDADMRLLTLTDEDPLASLPDVLSWSLKNLPSVHATLVGLLGLTPGPDIAADAAACLADLSSAETHAALRGLQQASLIDQDADGRYRMHDLIRLHARDHAARTLQEPDREQALRRIIDYYNHTAYAADRLLDPHVRVLEDLAPPAGASHRRHLTDRAEALDWFSAELPCLLAAQQEAAAHGWDRIAWQVGLSLTNFLYWRGLVQETESVSRAALFAAERLDHVAARSWAHRHLGNALIRLGRTDESVDQLTWALELAETLQDLDHQAHTHASLVVARTRQGRPREARQHAYRALELYRNTGHTVREAFSLNAVAWCEAELGNYTRAEASCHQALTTFRNTRHADGQAATLDTLGYIAHASGRPAEAVAHYRRSLTLRREQEQTSQVADTLEHLGHPYLALGQYDQTRAAWSEALHLYLVQGRQVEASRVERQLEAVPEDGRTR